MNRRQNNWALSSAFTLLLLLSICSLAASGPSAKTLYQRGQLRTVVEKAVRQ
jgi:hypothetical protein